MGKIQDFQILRKVYICRLILSTLIISMLEKLVISDQLSLDFLTVAKLTNQTSHVSQY